MYPKAPKPALFTSSSTSIAFRRVKARISAGAPGWTRSAANTSTWIPCFDESSAAIFCSRSIRLAVRTKCVPAAASSLANARPIPALAPVTNAHLPAHRLDELPVTDASWKPRGMKPQLRMVRKNEIEIGNGSGGAVSAIGARENGVTDSSTLRLEPIEQAARPDEFSRQNSQAEQDYQPARARRDDHHDAESKQREPDQNLQKAFALLQTFNKHLLGPLHPVRRIVQESDVETFPARGLPIMERFADCESPANTGLFAMFDRTSSLLDSNSGNFFPSGG